MVAALAAGLGATFNFACVAEAWAAVRLAMAVFIFEDADAASLPAVPVVTLLLVARFLFARVFAAITRDRKSVV